MEPVHESVMLQDVAIVEEIEDRQGVLACRRHQRRGAGCDVPMSRRWIQ